MKKHILINVLILFVICAMIPVYAKAEESENEISDTVQTEETTVSSSVSDEADTQTETPLGEEPVATDTETGDEPETDSGDSGAEEDPEVTKEPAETKEEDTEEPIEGSEDKNEEEDQAEPSKPQEETAEEDKEKESETDTTTPSEQTETQTEPEKKTEEDVKKQELEEAKKAAENKENKEPVLASNGLWIANIEHASIGNPLSGAKYGRLFGLTDFNFFTAQESGSYSAYTVSEKMIMLGKYQFTDFGAQGNGTAGALIAYMQACCSADVQYLYDALYQAYIGEQRTAFDEWNACASYDTENFMSMQDQFAYEIYYVRGEQEVEAAGIRLSERPWIVKGMCFSIFNTLGPYNEYGSGAYAITTSGVTNEDTNAEFIRKICEQMVYLYADEYTWMYGRFADGSDTAMGISDKELALEILSGALYDDPEAVTDKISRIRIKSRTDKTAIENGAKQYIVEVFGKREWKYSGETTVFPLQAGKDYRLSFETDEKSNRVEVVATGKGGYAGQVLKKTYMLSNTPPKER